MDVVDAAPENGLPVTTKDKVPAVRVLVEVLETIGYDLLPPDNARTYLSYNRVKFLNGLTS